MKARLEKFESGWVGVGLCFREDELDLVIERLCELKSGKVNHFHFRNLDFTSEDGIADVEISIMGVEEQDNMEIE